MSFTFAPARREQVSLLIALAGASGSGKTYSALRLAKGMAPSGKIAFIDTEARRGLHYAEQFDFMHADMRPPFRPASFVEGIHAAEAAGAEVVIIDSFSHEYDGEGGITDWADDLERSGTKSPGNWKIPKQAHKKLMNALLQCRASIIFCLRADEKIRIARENGKTIVEPLGWMPICEKRFMFEMTASFTLTPDRPGIPNFNLPHKLQSQHRAMFSDRSPIGEDSGRALAEWARGGSPAPATPHPDKPAAQTSAPPSDVRERQEDGADELTAAEWDIKLGEAAEKGTEQLKTVWESIPPGEDKKMLEGALNRRHKPNAKKVDQLAGAPA
jgi:hypothetical protein